MKRLLLATALAASTLPALATDVGVSVTIGQPGFYGHIDIGDFPRPRLIYAEPRIIVRGPIREPIYLHVPPGHAKNWRKYCSRYDACGRPVYFVQESWYNDVYVPKYRERHGGGRNDRDDRRDYGDHHDNDRSGHDSDQRGGKPDKGSRGHGNGNGKGNGRGRD